MIITLTRADIGLLKASTLGISIYRAQAKPAEVLMLVIARKISFYNLHSTHVNLTEKCEKVDRKEQNQCPEYERHHVDVDAKCWEFSDKNSHL